MAVTDRRTGCHFPCTRMHYSLLDGFVVDTSSLQLIQGAHTGITIRKFQTSTMTMFSEVVLATKPTLLHGNCVFASSV